MVLFVPAVALFGNCLDDSMSVCARALALL